MERFPLPLGAWDGLRYFIVALPEPSINFITYAGITLKIQSADRILVFLSADKHQFVGRLMLLHSRQFLLIYLKSHKAVQSADRRPITFESSDDRPMIGRRSADTSADEKGLIQI